MYKMFITSFIVIATLLSCSSSSDEINENQSLKNNFNVYDYCDTDLMTKIIKIDGFVAVWKFDEEPGTPRMAISEYSNKSYPLEEKNKIVERVEEGPLSNYSIKLDGTNYLSLSNQYTKDLNIYGVNSEVTVVAWVKWNKIQTSFIAGMWNEYSEGGKRQYGLFLSLPYYNGDQQVCGHISNTGKPTIPFPFSIDYSASKQKVSLDKWSCVAFTYDSKYIKSYFNGEFEEREPELIKNTQGFYGYPEGLTQSKNPYWFPYGLGNNGSDFTVGAVLLKKGVGNYYNGLIGGVAIYNRALTQDEIKKIVN